jgi:hypothetical protein
MVKSALYDRRGAGGKVAIEDQAYSTGDRYFVHSGTGSDAAAYGSSPDKPYATIDYANGQCTASKGDIIYVMPGHAESLSTATSLVMDVIGVQVIGIGTGRLKPQITVDTATTALWSITAANCLIKNVDIITNYLDVATAMTVGGSADGLTLDGVNFLDTSVILGALIGITIAADVDDITIRNCKYYGVALTGAATDCIDAAGGCDRLTIENCFFTGEFSGNVIALEAAASTDIQLKDLLVINMSESGGGIDLNSGTTGWAHEVQAYLEDHTGSEPAITGAALAQTDRVKFTNAVGASTRINIAADS